MSAAGCSQALSSRGAFARTLATRAKHLLMGIAVGLAMHGPAALAHDAIGSDARKTYLARLDALHRTTQASADAAVRAQAHYQIGRTLDEIRELLNQDILSHGKTQGLETSLLVQQLNASPTPLAISPTTRLYAANLRHYRQAIVLDVRAGFGSAARFMIFKGQFYDSFTDDPLHPPRQTREELIEMTGIGEALMREPEGTIDREELAFILAMHYLQADRAGQLPRDTARRRVAELLRELRQRHPQSLKLATLEALASP